MFWCCGNEGGCEKSNCGRSYTISARVGALLELSCGNDAVKDGRENESLSPRQKGRSLKMKALSFVLFVQYRWHAVGFTTPPTRRDCYYHSLTHPRKEGSAS